VARGAASWAGTVTLGARQTCDFEAELTWALGMKAQQTFHGENSDQPVSAGRRREVVAMLTALTLSPEATIFPSSSVDLTRAMPLAARLPDDEYKGYNALVEIEGRTTVTFRLRST